MTARTETELIEAARLSVEVGRRAEESTCWIVGECASEWCGSAVNLTGIHPIPWPIDIRPHGKRHFRCPTYGRPSSSTCAAGPFTAARCGRATTEPLRPS